MLNKLNLLRSDTHTRAAGYDTLRFDRHIPGIIAVHVCTAGSEKTCGSSAARRLTQRGPEKVAVRAVISAHRRKR